MIINVINGGVQWAAEEPIEYDWVQASIEEDNSKYILEFEITDDCRKSRVISIEFRDKKNEKIANKNGFVIEEHFNEIYNAWDRYSNKHFR